MSGPVLKARVGSGATASGPGKCGACTMVILGAGGDLTRRKLIPSLLRLLGDGLLDPALSVIGVGRSPSTDEGFRAELRQEVSSDAGLWEQLAPRLHWITGDLTAEATYQAIRERLERIETDAGGERGRLFYLAIPPSLYAPAVLGLSRSGAAPWQDDPGDCRWARVIIEKPFGRSRKTAVELNRAIGEVLAEHQVFRIDHYLGKETVQNLMVFRFANSIFEPVWNRHHIHHVQITAAEILGVEHRAGYYEEAGVVRDMFQNHLLQLLALTAMEPPVSPHPEAVRDEKAKVLRAIRPPAASDPEAAILGQYGAGSIEGKPVPGYREEAGVAPGSRTPTFAAMRMLIDNWRWEGVPFFLRSGKRLPRRDTEIAIQFREPPRVLFPDRAAQPIEPNVLVIQVQPDEGLSLSFQIKVPGEGMRVTEARMDFSYAEAFGPLGRDAYETLLLDCMTGDATLFIRADAVEAAWRAVDPVIEGYEGSSADPLFYPAGSWGPAASKRMLDAAGARWRG